MQIRQQFFVKRVNAEQAKLPKNTGAFGLFEYFGEKPPYITQKRI